MKWYVQRVKNLGHLLVNWVWVLKYGYPARKLHVVGVTGTDGKTTTTTLLYEVFKAAGIRVGMISTNGAKYFVDGREEKIDLGLHVTTPSAKSLQAMIKKMADAGVAQVFIETTAHGLDQYRVVGCNYEVGVMTNLTQDHLDDFGTMERYAKAKLKLFRGVSKAILNKDDSWFDWYRQIIKVPIVEYGKTNIKNISSALEGEYNKYNIAAVETVANYYKIDSKVVERVVENFSGVEGRREEIKNKKGIRLIVDFAHTPNGLEQLLKSLQTKSGNLILVFGCTGERDASKRPIMGQVAEKYADEVIVTADDPRNESLETIYSQIVAKTAKKFLRIDDRDEAILKAVSLAHKGDTVVATGMGHEKTIRIGNQEIERSDRAAFEKAISI